MTDSRPKQQKWLTYHGTFYSEALLKNLDCSSMQSLTSA
jgi:hypothetical protein